MRYRADRDLGIRKTARRDREAGRQEDRETRVQGESGQETGDKKTWRREKEHERRETEQVDERRNIGDGRQGIRETCNKGILIVGHRKMKI